MVWAVALQVMKLRHTHRPTGLQALCITCGRKSRRNYLSIRSVNLVSITLKHARQFCAGASPLAKVFTGKPLALLLCPSSRSVLCIPSCKLSITLLMLLLTRHFLQCFGRQPNLQSRWWPSVLHCDLQHWFVEGSWRFPRVHRSESQAKTFTRLTRQDCDLSDRSALQASSRVVSFARAEWPCGCGVQVHVQSIKPQLQDRFKADVERELRETQEAQQREEEGRQAAVLPGNRLNISFKDPSSRHPPAGPAPPASPAAKSGPAKTNPETSP